MDIKEALEQSRKIQKTRTNIIFGAVLVFLFLITAVIDSFVKNENTMYIVFAIVLVICYIVKKALNEVMDIKNVFIEQRDKKSELTERLDDVKKKIIYLQSISAKKDLNEIDRKLFLEKLIKESRELEDEISKLVEEKC